MHKQQIDYILVRRKWRNSVHNAQAYNSFASIGSDHRVVSARIRLSLRAPAKKAIRKTKYIWKALEGNAELQERYAVKVRNKFQLLDQEPATEMYERLSTAIREAAEETLEAVPKRKKKQLFSENERIRLARQEVEGAYLEFVGSGEMALGNSIETRK